MHLDYQLLKLNQQIHPNLSLRSVGEIPVLVLEHAVGKAAISLQGAQLLSWQPHFAKHDVIWLSDSEPFKQGSAIRGGVPVCYPWFGRHGEPMHGYARVSMWQLTAWQVDEDAVSLTFCLFDEHHLVEAKLEMIFTEQCRLRFTHYGVEPAEAALHTYYNIGDITQTTLFGLPDEAFSNAQQQTFSVNSPLMLDGAFDAIFTADQQITHIDDKAQGRIVEVEHINASDIVVWNPWENTPSQMRPEGYKTMICVETARIRHKLVQKEVMEAVIRVQR
ncbi:D-hexose-6-phosphate mutarotase [Pasteurellaceae bacterium 20609_3]|uniref:D-hexose-6-phosphate mutarotase n=1 Tax=Spirabiliibacterium mucosae TaxID=28156 RepID=UPI001AACB1A3|nr:D-hexose-6-phosphate mutarotase [Spirabiliibacterium mucosae]MBE2897563.1 D-hexose-6-phosphate mutarotase [Spirabiliibacterium mucosae]